MMSTVAIRSADKSSMQHDVDSSCYKIVLSRKSILGVVDKLLVGAVGAILGNLLSNDISYAMQKSHSKVEKVIPYVVLLSMAILWSLLKPILTRREKHQPQTKHERQSKPDMHIPCSFTDADCERFLEFAATLCNHSVRQLSPSECKGTMTPASIPVTESHAVQDTSRMQELTLESDVDIRGSTPRTEHVVLFVPGEVQEEIRPTEEAFQSDEPTLSGSKILHKRLQRNLKASKNNVGYNSHALVTQLVESLRRAHAVNKDSTLQLGNLAVWKYTDTGLSCWKLKKDWTPIIYDITCSRTILDLVTGRRGLWILTGLHCQRATLKVSTKDKSELLNVINYYKADDEIEVLICEEPHLVPTLRDRVYITALREVTVEQGVTVTLCSKPDPVQRAYWISVLDALIPSVTTALTVTMILYIFAGLMESRLLQMLPRSDDIAVTSNRISAQFNFKSGSAQDAGLSTNALSNVYNFLRRYGLPLVLAWALELSSKFLERSDHTVFSRRPQSNLLVTEGFANSALSREGQCMVVEDHNDRVNAGATATEDSENFDGRLMAQSHFVKDCNDFGTLNATPRQFTSSMDPDAAEISGEISSAETNPSISVDEDQLMASCSLGVDPQRNLSEAVDLNFLLGELPRQLLQQQPEGLQLQSPEQEPPSQVTMGNPLEDGYTWRKYGQKQVKGSDYTNSYYKCTNQNCPIRKKVKRSNDGEVTEIVYKGEHNHYKPPPTRRLALTNAHLNNGDEGHRTHDHGEVLTLPRNDLPMGVFERKSVTEDGDADEHNSEQREIMKWTRLGKELRSAARTIEKPPVVFQTQSDVDIADDGYRWRKYGQKVVKGNPHPRSYYKCTNLNCPVRKQVERSSNDPKTVIATVEGEHNHDVPPARNNGHNDEGFGAEHRPPPLRPPFSQGVTCSPPSPSPSPSRPFELRTNNNQSLLRRFQSSDLFAEWEPAPAG